MLDPRIREDDGVGVSGAGRHRHGVNHSKPPQPRHTHGVTILKLPPPRHTCAGRNPVTESAWGMVLHSATACFRASDRFMAPARSVLDPRIREDDGVGVSGAGGDCHGVNYPKPPQHRHSCAGMTEEPSAERAEMKRL